jgi:hypothetical protein
VQFSIKRSINPRSEFKIVGSHRSMNHLPPKTDRTKNKKTKKTLPRIDLPTEFGRIA